MAMRVETAQMNDGEQTWWTWGIYDGERLILDAGEDSYETRGEALLAGTARMEEIADKA